MICAPVTWLRQELFSPLPRVSTTRVPSHLHRAFPPPFISRYLNGPPRYIIAG